MFAAIFYYNQIAIMHPLVIVTNATHIFAILSQLLQYFAKQQMHKSNKNATKMA